MAALGRLLQVIGWLWLVAGFILPALDLADITVFPGLILIFVARALRTQAARHAPAEPAAEEQAPEERILNTDRVRVEPQPSPKPPPPSPQPVTIPRQTDARPKPSASSERESLIERIAEAGREAEADLAEPDRGKLDVTAPRGSAKPMSSEEMIAGAGREAEADQAEPGRGKLDVTAPRGSAKPMSSEEMIAEARRRWNTDKRPGRS